jgi:hypothetical protein
MTLYPETAIVFIFWMASLAVCCYGKAWVDTKEEVKCQEGAMIRAKEENDY